RSVSLDHIVNTQPRSWNEDEIRPPDIVDGRRRLNGDRPIALHRTAVHRSCLYLKVLLFRFSHEMVPQKTCMPENFHRTHGSRGKGLIKNQDGDVNHEPALRSANGRGVIAYLQWHICHLVARRFCKYLQAIEYVCFEIQE